MVRSIKRAGFSTNKVASFMEKYNPNEYLRVGVIFYEYLNFTNLLFVL